jgi:hypothetical protein
LKGTLYASAGNVTIGGNESWTVDSRMVADTLKFVDSFTDTFSVNANYSPDPKLLLVK